MATIPAGQFFGDQTEGSARKTEIVIKYFDAWSKIMTGTKLNKQRIVYLDPFAGAGTYSEKGTPSTPIGILEMILQNPKLKDRVALRFNENNPEMLSRLQTNLSEVIGYTELKFPPKFTNYDVTEYGMDLARETIGYPTLAFVDPFGYKGISRELLSQLTTGFGCDCIFFFNYNRIRGAIENPSVVHHMNGLFGEARVKRLRVLLSPDATLSNEEKILTEITNALKEMNIPYSIFFRFKDKKDVRTMHHLGFITKDKTAYRVMKDIMASASSSEEQGVASFEHSSKKEVAEAIQLSFFGPLESLEESLLVVFAGRTISVEDIFAEHGKTNPRLAQNYTLSNYKDALKRLEYKAMIATNEPHRRKDTLSDKVKITFPSK